MFSRMVVYESTSSRCLLFSNLMAGFCFESLIVATFLPPIRYVYEVYALCSMRTAGNSVVFWTSSEKGRFRALSWFRSWTSCCDNNIYSFVYELFYFSWSQTEKKKISSTRFILLTIVTIGCRVFFFLVSD